MAVDALVAVRRAWSFGSRLCAKRLQLRACELRGRVPVVTYATWRTSSTAVHHAIRASRRGPAVKAHSLHAPNISHRMPSMWSAEARRDAHVGDWAVSGAILGRGRVADWVVLVRDPLAMAMSLLAMRFGSGLPGVAGCTLARGASHGAPTDGELDRLLSAAPIGALDRWFSDDLRPALGWSPLDEPFDRDRGWTETQCPHGRVLLMRADVPDDEKSSALSGFLGTPVRVRPKNGADSHGRSGVLGALATRLRDHPEVVAASLALRSSRHFWHETQLRMLRDRWMPATAVARIA